MSAPRPAIPIEVSATRIRSVVPRSGCGRARTALLVLALVAAMPIPSASGAASTAGPPPAVDDEYLERRVETDYLLNQTEAERDAMSQRLDEASAELSALHATDARLEAAIAALDDQIAAVVAEIAQAEADQQEAIRREITLNHAAVEALAEVEAWREVVTARAVEAYIHPDRGASVVSVVQSSDFSVAARKAVLLKAVAASDRAVFDELSRAEAALVERERQADAAGELAAASRRSATAARAELDAARAEQTALKAELEDRIAAFRAEVDALAAQQETLNRLIAARYELLRAEVEQRALWRSECAQGLVPVDDRGVAVDCGSLDDPIPPSSMRWPTAGPVSSEFGERWGRMHQGIDFAADTGTPIVAAESGVVFFAGWIDGYGNTVLIDHGGGVTTLYGHQSSIAVGEGYTVTIGETIGFVGSTGNSTGPHLHFEVRIDGTPVDPRRFLG